MTEAKGLAAQTLYTPVPLAPQTPEAGSIGVCVEDGDLCVVIFAEHGRQQIVARLNPGQADYFCGLLADAMQEIVPLAAQQIDTARENWGTLQ